MLNQATRYLRAADSSYGKCHLKYLIPKPNLVILSEFDLLLSLP